MNLIRKDFMLVKNKMLAYGFLCTFITLLFKLMIDHTVIDNALVCAIGVLFSYFNTIISFEAEGKYKAQATIVTLPYIRENIITAKYLSILLINILYYAMNLLLMAGMYLLRFDTWPGKGILYGIACSLLVSAFMIPFFIRFDYIKAANVMMLGFMLVGVVIALFSKRIGNANEWILETFLIDGKYLFFISLIFILLSYLISTNIYTKKEFF
ncbi:MAG: ABC-2 transporter permease [Candidatus Galacturonibacter soehngenii]|nr:ABC-2 transporter permease [Candidatus Galacturonibacter soehngenii]